MDLLIDPVLDPLPFLLEAGAEFARAVLEEHQKTKGEKDEKDQPEKAAQ